MGKQVLVIANSRHVQATCSMHLGRMGHEVHVAFNGMEAKMLHRSWFDMIIMEHNLPRMTSIELLGHFHERIPVIVLAESNVDYSAHQQVKHVLAKPFRPEVLVALVTELLLL